MKVLSKLKDVLTYKPKIDNQFELLEGSMEGREQESAASTNRMESGATIVSTSIEDNLKTIQSELDLQNNNDIVIREFKVARKIRAFVIYIDSMIDGTFISNFVIHELMEERNFQDYFESKSQDSILDYINDNVISAQEIFKMKDFAQLLSDIAGGITVLFIEGCDQCLCINAKGYAKRDVDKPMIESVIFGSQEAFNESMRTNISLVRKLIRNKQLRTEIVKVGSVNQAHCAIMYLEGIANPEVIQEVKRRIAGIDTDYIMGSGMIGQFIEDHPYSLFPQMLTTERPDRTASYIAEGKIAIISEGMPFADIVPITFYHLLQTSEDAMLRWQYGTFLKLIRLVGLFAATLLPAIYVALILFHEEAIPTELLAAIATSKEDVPFPTVLEMVLLELAFELIREGSIRVPGVIGQTLGIVGALILGQAAVTAKLVSPIMIIIVAITGIGSFALPNYPLGFGFRIIKFCLIFLAAFMGFYGICGGIFILGILSCSMKSFGVPFFAPVAPKTLTNKDLIFKMPAWKQKIRPDYLNTLDRKRQGNPSRKWVDKGKGGGN